MRGEADIDQCPPGGDETARALAVLLGQTVKPVNLTYGTVTTELVALIDESRCIGCARCLPACPVDAIVGAQRRMHTVIIGQCTGCELCLPPCPVDCIAMVPAPAAARARETARPRADEWRERHARHEKRLNAAADSERRAFESAREQARAR